MSSLLGLASYDSDHTDADEATGGDDGRRSQTSEGSVEDLEGIRAPKEETTEPLEENSNSRLGENVGEDGSAHRSGNTRASSFDAPVPPTKESRQFFMPLPSPLIRLDHASATSPFHPHDLNNESACTDPDGGGHGSGSDKDDDDEGDGDIINPEHRDMLPPEATGQANPQLQAKIAKFLDTIHGDFTKIIKGKKDYGNPAVLAQICRYCNVDDKGTNYPDDRMVHPSVYDTKDFHDSLMAEFRRAKREEKKAQPPAAPPATSSHLRSGAVATTARTTADAVTQSTSATVAPATGTTSTRGSKWGDAAPTPATLPVIGRPLQMGAEVAAAAAAAAVAAAAAAAAGAGQKAILTAQAQASQVAKDAQQRAEAIAKQQMINRLEKAKQDQGMREQPSKKPRLS